MRTVLAFAAALAAASGPALADGYGPGHKGMKPHARHHAVHGSRYYHRAAVLPGVLGMDRGGVLYWRPAVEPLPRFIFDEYGHDEVHGHRVVSARY